jgi:hypothetical protein
MVINREWQEYERYSEISSHRHENEARNRIDMHVASELEDNESVLQDH